MDRKVSADKLEKKLSPGKGKKGKVIILFFFCRVVQERYECVFTCCQGNRVCISNECGAGQPYVILFGRLRLEGGSADGFTCVLGTNRCDVNVLFDPVSAVRQARQHTPLLDLIVEKFATWKPGRQQPSMWSHV